MNGILLRCVFVIAFCLLKIISLDAQSYLNDNLFFSIKTEKDTIDFIKVGADITTSKPTILFCQGSMPFPLVVTYQGDHYYIPVVSNYNYREVSERYNIVIISMPHTPVVADLDSLTPSIYYVPDITKPHEMDKRYVMDNYLEKYVERGNLVLEFLRKQPWVDNNKIILAGHSQGTYIAADLASQNNDIFAVGYLSGNPLGRYLHFILEQRNKAKSGEITIAEAQSNIEDLYQGWEYICDNPDEVPVTGDSPRTWTSFTVHRIDQLSALKMPVYVAYGTEDIAAQFCDFLPIYFEMAGKKNYKCKAYVGYGHNFEEIMPDGKSDFNKMHWQEAINEFLEWCEQL